MVGLTSKTLCITGVVAITACTPDLPATPDTDDGSGTDTDATTTSSTTGTSSESGPEPVCMPGERRCDGEDAEEVCADDGLAWEPSPCAMGEVCVACEEEPCAETLCASPCDASAGASSAGCSFLASRQLGLTEILAPKLGVPEEEWAPDGLVLVNPSDAPANVQVHDLAQGSLMPMPLGDPIVLGPFESHVVELRTPLPLGGISILRIGSLVWVESDAPILAFSYSPYPPFVGNDSSMLLPEASLGLHYVVPSYPPHYLQYQGAGRPTYFDVIATEAGTSVRWQAQFTSTSGSGFPIEAVPEGEWSKQYMVDRFEGLRVLADAGAREDDHDADVSGMVIEATAPVYVIGGSRCSAVPASEEVTAGCDPLTEALIPIEQWGQTYVVPAPPVQGPDHEHVFRIYGADEGIAVTTMPNVVEHVFASRGDYVDVVVPNGTSFVVEADGPVMVVGYLASRNPDAPIGDPAMFQHVPVEQGDVRYAFAAPPDWDTQYIQLARSSGGADVVLDDVAVADWVAVGEWEVATVTVEAGVHVLASDEPFTATQFAFNNSPLPSCDPYDASSVCHSSYAHPVGMLTATLNEL